MKSHVLFKGLVLGSVFSASLSYSALALIGDDFKTVGLEREYSEAPQSVQAKLSSTDLDQGLLAAKRVDELTNDPEATTSKAYLEQVLKALAAQDSGDVEGQDGETFTGFGNQIDKYLRVLQNVASIQQKLNNFGIHSTNAEFKQLRSTLNFFKDNTPIFLAARKEMAKVFWIRRVGYNPQHKDAFENAWDALLRYKKIDLIITVLTNLSEDSQIQSIYDITETTKSEAFTVSMTLLKNLPTHLLMDISEFSEELFGPKTIQSLIQKYPDLKNILQFRTEGKSFTSREIELLKKMYPMLKLIPEFAEKKFTFAQILDLRDKYKVPYQVCWAGDNEDFSKSSAKIQEAAIDPLNDLGMDQEANRIFGRAMMLQARQMYLNEILVRVMGRLEPQKTVEINKKLAEIRQAERALKDRWVEHVLGRQLQKGEEFPKEAEFQAFLKHLHIQAAQHFVFKKGELHETSISWLGESVQVRLAEILGRLKKTFSIIWSLNGNDDSEVKSWVEDIDEDNLEYFQAGDKDLFLKSLEEVKRFIRIVNTVIRKKADTNADQKIELESVYYAYLKGDQIATKKLCTWSDDIEGESFQEGDKEFFDDFGDTELNRILTGIYSVLGQKELADHPEYVVWKLATESRPKEQIKQSLLLRIQGYEQQLEKDLFLSRNPEIKSSPFDLLERDQDNVKTWGSAPVAEDRQKLALGSALEAAGRHALQATAYSFMGGIIETLKEVKDNSHLFVQKLTTQFDLFTQLMNLATHKEKLSEQLGNLPHWVRTFNHFEGIWKSIPEELRTAIQDIYKHGAVIKALKLKAQQENRELKEEEYKGHAEKVLAANQLLVSPLEMPSVVAAQIHEAAKGLNTYRMTKDMRYTSGLVRLWWEKRPAAENFKEGERRFDDVLMLRQFLELSTNTTLPEGTKQRALEAIWDANEHKPNIIEYM